MEQACLPFPLTLKQSNVKLKKEIYLLLTFVLLSFAGQAEDGYDLWLRYKTIENQAVLDKYRAQISGYVVEGYSPTLEAVKTELNNGLSGLLDKPIAFGSPFGKTGWVIAGTPEGSSIVAGLNLTEELKIVGQEGYLISNRKVRGVNALVIAANSEVGVLYGTFHLLRLIQTHQPLDNDFTITDSPKIQHRILNHWDNLDQTVERGYAGFSLWKWHLLPGYIDPRYVDYARACASIGINGTAITNVNAKAVVLTPMYLEKVKALADVFRPYGLKVYLTARFSAPIEIGGLETADPLDPKVQQWWKDKVTEIMTYVPDFGGFTVKANSEGQPGPQNYGRSHADGANMLADAVAPHGGIVMWRAFVYSNEQPVDRAKQAYDEFKPLDGTFRKNVMVQVKNGAIDFQPREPFHPLFGAMPKTPIMAEFQITQEYLGQATNLCYLAPLFKETLDADTYARGANPGPPRALNSPDLRDPNPTERPPVPQSPLPINRLATVAKVVDGTLDGQAISGIAGVTNIGNDRNWTGHPFGQANWFAFGRLAWNHELSSAHIANEWLKMTFTNDPTFVEPMREMMLTSRETVVNYSTPLGLHHIMGAGHHYGPGPWVSKMSRADWTSVYYHKADSAGIGFDRTATGSNALEQYTQLAAQVWADPKTCPDRDLLWFHHLPWDFKMKSGKTLWEEIALHYQQGVDEVRQMQQKWKEQQSTVDKERWEHVNMLLSIQEQEAVWWRNSCLLYFQTFSKRPLPKGVEKSDKTLEYYMDLKFPYAPGRG